MNGEGLYNRQTTDYMEETDGVIIVQGSGAFALPEDIQDFLNATTDPAELGLPVPTAQEAGKMLAVNDIGNGFCLADLQNTDLLWENPAPGADFSAQTIACNLTKYSMLAICFRESGAGVRKWTKIEYIPKTGGTFQTGIKLISRSLISSYMRDVSATNGGVTFSDCRNYNIAPGHYSVYDEPRFHVPTKIFGIM